MKTNITQHIGHNLKSLVLNPDLSINELRLSSENLLVLAFQTKIITAQEFSVSINLLLDYIESGCAIEEIATNYIKQIELLF